MLLQGYRLDDAPKPMGLLFI